jgi:hypothetical protein
MEEKEVVQQPEAVAVDEFAKDGYDYVRHIVNGKQIIFYVEKETPINVACDAALDIALHFRLQMHKAFQQEQVVKTEEVKPSVEEKEAN